MVWAESPTITNYGAIYYYDANTDSYTSFTTPESGRYYLYPLIALSGDGSRFMHYQYVYDENMSFLGSLNEATNVPGLNWDGSRALALTGEGIKVFDLTSDVRPFPQIGNTVNIDPTLLTGATKVYTTRLGDVAFVFGSNGTVYRMIVRNVPATAP